jgi:type IV pilus assembly protein PilC
MAQTVKTQIKAKKPKLKALPALPVFVWEGKDARGLPMTGEMAAKTIGLVKADLRRQNIIVKVVKPKRRSIFKSGGKKIKGRDIALVSRQLATMMQSGVPLVSALDIMAQGQQNIRMAKMLGAIRDDLAGGTSLSEAISKFPVYFDELYQNLVRAGENAGVLDTVLETVATYKERMESLKGKIKKAMFYPTAVMAVAGLVSAILLMYVVPQFEDVFKGFGADLPAFTQIIVNMSRFLISYWYIVFGAIGAIAYTAITLFKRSVTVQHGVDKVLLRTPVIGKILHGSALARFARTLAITFKAGVPLVEAMQTVSGATGSETYRKAVLRMRDDISVGFPVNLSMKQTKLFPHMVVQMVAIGEEAGALDSMLEKVADFYEEEVNNQVDALSSLLEPFIMVIIGGIVGSMVIGMYLPIFKMGEVVG